MRHTSHNGHAHAYSTEHKRDTCCATTMNAAAARPRRFVTNAAAVVVCGALVVLLGALAANAEGDFLGASEVDLYGGGCRVIRKGELHLRWRVVDNGTSVDFALQGSSKGLLAPGTLLGKRGGGGRGGRHVRVLCVGG